MGRIETVDMDLHSRYQFKADHKLRSRLLHQFQRRKQKLFESVGTKCVLCGHEHANSLHHLVPVGYANDTIADKINTPINVVPCCHNLQIDDIRKQCHFRLNGASWVVIEMYKKFWYEWTLEQWASTILKWIDDHRDELMKHTAREIVKSQ